MTIAFVFEIFLPVINGIITSSHNLAKNLTAKGHRIIYIAPKWEKSTLDELDGIPVYYVPSIDSFAYPGMRVVLPWSRRVERIIKKEEVDVVHSTGPWLLNYAALRAAKRLNIATVQTFHTMLQEPSYIRYFTHTRVLIPLLRAIAWKYFGLYMKRSDVVTGPSHYVVRELAAHYKNLPLRRIPNGIDIGEFAHGGSFEEVQEKYSFFNEKTFIFIGRLGEEKSVSRLIDAFALAYKEDNELRLLLIGDGPSRKDYELQVHELGLQHSILFLGKLSPKDLYTGGLIHNARANVTASTTESFGMTIVESMAAGTPSIVPDVPGVVEIADNTGLTFHKDNLHECAKRILELAHNRELCSRLSEQCLQHSIYFDGKVVAGQFEDLYREVVEVKKNSDASI